MLSKLGKVEYHTQSGMPSSTFEIIMSADGKLAGLEQRGSSFGRAPAEIGKEILDHALKVYPY
jgi:hypothetical protein